jgi:hypothetical protein
MCTAICGLVVEKDGDEVFNVRVRDGHRSFMSQAANARVVALSTCLGHRGAESVGPGFALVDEMESGNLRVLLDLGRNPGTCSPDANRVMSTPKLKTLDVLAVGEIAHIPTMADACFLVCPRLRKIVLYT